MGADKGYHNAELVSFCREHGIAPHVAQIKGREVKGLDNRTTRTLATRSARRCANGSKNLWLMQGMRRARKRGADRVGYDEALGSVITRMDGMTDHQHA